MNLTTKMRYFYSTLARILRLFSGYPLTITNAAAGNLNEYTVLGNSKQEGTPTPTSPIEVTSVGDKVTDSSDPHYNQHKIPVINGANCGVVDLGTLTWAYVSPTSSAPNGYFVCYGVPNKAKSSTNQYLYGYTYNSSGSVDRCVWGSNSYSLICITDFRYTDAASFKAAMSGKYLYYQRTTDASWTIPTTTNIYASAPLRKVGTYADVLNSDGTITRNVGVKVLDGTENWTKRTDEGVNRYQALIFNNKPSGVPVCLSTHFKNVFSYATLLDGCFLLDASERGIFDKEDITTVQDFKSWLAAQNTAGTPVIIYYPLATPTTEVNATPAITVAKGMNVLTTGTELVPSNMTAKAWTE